MSACQAAFNYGMLKFGEITSNPFYQLHKLTSPPRRQRWTDQQLTNFIRKANEMGYPSIGLCALLCMELVQRPGDILNMKWGAYEERDKTWYIRQSKRGAVVRIPETQRLRMALRSAKARAIQGPSGEISELLICATVTGKRWHRRNFTGTARRIARLAGLPDDLQIRDLRRTGATEAASAGATPLELMAVGGWANQASIRPYLVQTVEQAASVQAKRDAYRRGRINQRRRRFLSATRCWQESPRRAGDGIGLRSSFSVPRHRSVIMFGMLVVVLRPDNIPGPGFFLGQREKSLIASLRASGRVRLGPVGVGRPPLWAGNRLRARFELARWFSAVLHGSILGDIMAPGQLARDEKRSRWNMRCPGSAPENGLVISEGQ
jgi:hypothetical protein